MSHPGLTGDIKSDDYVMISREYNNGYEDGKKAGKEYCNAELTRLRAEIKSAQAVTGNMMAEYATMRDENEALKDSIYQTRLRLLAIRSVGFYLGHETVRRDSVLDQFESNSGKHIKV